MKKINFSVYWISLVSFQFFMLGDMVLGYGINIDGSNSLAVAGNHPYQVAILQRVSFNFEVIDGKKFICGGSLINSQWVLTAAQCTKNPNLRLVLGMNNIRAYETFQQTFDITERDVIVHPNYNEENYENDIALIRLPATIQFNDHIQPISLDEKDGGTHVHETVFLSGWGTVTPFNPVADYLRQTTLKVIPNEVCQKLLLQPFFYIRCNQLCTAGAQVFSESGACSGDTGAPLVKFNAKKARPEQIAIVTKPPFLCKGTEPTVFTRISEHKDWIDEVIGEQDCDSCSENTTRNIEEISSHDRKRSEDD